MADRSLQADWETREFIETLTLGIKRIGEFLNRFDVDTRYQLAKVDEKISALEHKIAVVENKVASIS